MARAPTPAQRKRQELKIGPPAEDDPAFRTEAEPAAENIIEVNGVSGQRLLSFIERIERLKEDIRAMQEDVREIKSEAKGTGFDVKVINHLIKIRAQDKDDRDEFETLSELYQRAIGMIP